MSSLRCSPQPETQQLDLSHMVHLSLNCQVHWLAGSRCIICRRDCGCACRHGWAGPVEIDSTGTGAFVGKSEPQRHCGLACYHAQMFNLLLLIITFICALSVQLVSTQGSVTFASSPDCSMCNEHVALHPVNSTMPESSTKPSRRRIKPQLLKEFKSLSWSLLA